MKINLMVFFVLTLLVNINKCNSSNENLCTAMQESEEKVKTVLNTYLKTLDDKKDVEDKYKEIEAFLLRQNCIEKVEFGRGYLRTLPPIKQVYLTTASESKIKNVIVNITLNNKEISVEKIVINRSL